jgi:hypothetical protein
MTEYNGWTNYATWRVNLEMFDGMVIDPLNEWSPDPTTFANQLIDWAHDMIEETSTEGIARDYALAFLQDVNWREIAQHLLAANAE